MTAQRRFLDENELLARIGAPTPAELAAIANRRAGAQAFLAPVQNAAELLAQQGGRGLATLVQQGAGNAAMGQLLRGPTAAAPKNAAAPAPAAPAKGRNAPPVQAPQNRTNPAPASSAKETPAAAPAHHNEPGPRSIAAPPAIARVPESVGHTARNQSARNQSAQNQSAQSAQVGTESVQTAPQTEQMPENVNAKAFAHGQDVHLGKEPAGKELLAHESEHVTQQQPGGTPATPLTEAGPQGTGPQALGADVFKQGSDVALSNKEPEQHVAHEAAHVVQQRSGQVQPVAGPGQSDATPQKVETATDPAKDATAPGAAPGTTPVQAAGGQATPGAQTELQGRQGRRGGLVGIDGVEQRVNTALEQSAPASGLRGFGGGLRGLGDRANSQIATTENRANQRVQQAAAPQDGGGLAGLGRRLRAWGDRQNTSIATANKDVNARAQQVLRPGPEQGGLGALGQGLRNWGNQQNARIAGAEDRLNTRAQETMAPVVNAGSRLRASGAEQNTRIAEKNQALNQGAQERLAPLARAGTQLRAFGAEQNTGIANNNAQLNQSATALSDRLAPHGNALRELGDRLNYGEREASAQPQQPSQQQPAQPGVEQQNQAQQQVTPPQTSTPSALIPEQSSSIQNNPAQNGAAASAQPTVQDQVTQQAGKETAATADAKVASGSELTTPQNAGAVAAVVEQQVKESATVPPSGVKAVPTDPKAPMNSPAQVAESVAQNTTDAYQAQAPVAATAERQAPISIAGQNMPTQQEQALPDINAVRTRSRSRMQMPPIPVRAQEQSGGQRDGADGPAQTDRRDPNQPPQKSPSQVQAEAEMVGREGQRKLGQAEHRLQDQSQSEAETRRTTATATRDGGEQRARAEGDAQTQAEDQRGAERRTQADSEAAQRDTVARAEGQQRETTANTQGEQQRTAAHSQHEAEVARQRESERQQVATAEQQSQSEVQTREEQGRREESSTQASRQEREAQARTQGDRDTQSEETRGQQDQDQARREQNAEAARHRSEGERDASSQERQGRAEQTRIEADGRARQRRLEAEAQRERDNQSLLGRAWDAVSSAFSSLMNRARDAWNSAVSLARRAWDSAVAMARSIRDRAAALAQRAIAAIDARCGGIISRVRAAVGRIVSRVRDLVSQAVAWCQEQIATIRNAVATWIRERIAQLRSFVESIRQRIVAFIEAARTMLQNALDAVVSFVRTAIEAARQWVAQTINAIATWVAETYESIRTFVVTAVTAIVARVTAFVQQAWSRFTTMMSQIGSWLSEQWTRFSQWAQEAFVKFWTGPWRDVLIGIAVAVLIAAVTVATGGVGLIAIVAISAGATAALRAGGEIAARRAAVAIRNDPNRAARFEGEMNAAGGDTAEWYAGVRADETWGGTLRAGAVEGARGAVEGAVSGLVGGAGGAIATRVAGGIARAGAREGARFIARQGVQRAAEFASRTAIDAGLGLAGDVATGYVNAGLDVQFRRHPDGRPYTWDEAYARRVAPQLTPGSIGARVAGSGLGSTLSMGSHRGPGQTLQERAVQRITGTAGDPATTSAARRVAASVTGSVADGVQGGVSAGLQSVANGGSFSEGFGQGFVGGVGSSAGRSITEVAARRPMGTEPGSQPQRTPDATATVTPHMQADAATTVVPRTQADTVVVPRGPVADTVATQVTAHPPAADTVATQVTARPPHLDGETTQVTARPPHLDNETTQVTARPPQVDPDQTVRMIRPEFQDDAAPTTRRPGDEAAAEPTIVRPLRPEEMTSTTQHLTEAPDAPRRAPTPAEINVHQADRLNTLLPGNVPGLPAHTRVVPDGHTGPLAPNQMTVSQARRLMRTISAMRRTETGRAALAAIESGSVQVTMTPGIGSFSQGPRINLDPNLPDHHFTAGILAHEAHHAATASTTPGRTETSRDAYVNGMLRNEAESQARALEYHRESGSDGSRQFGHASYHAAYYAEIAAQRGRTPAPSPAEAHRLAVEAGTRALQGEFGSAVPSTSIDETGGIRAGSPRNYFEHYGQDHDAANPRAPTTGTSGSTTHPAVDQNAPATTRRNETDPQAVSRRPEDTETAAPRPDIAPPQRPGDRLTARRDGSFEVEGPDGRSRLVQREDGTFERQYSERPRTPAEAERRCELTLQESRARIAEVETRTRSSVDAAFEQAQSRGQDGIVVGKIILGAGGTAVQNYATHDPARRNARTTDGAPDVLAIAQGGDPWPARQGLIGQTAEALSKPGNGLTHQPDQFMPQGAGYARTDAVGASIAETRARTQMPVYPARISSVEAVPNGQPARYRVIVETQIRNPDGSTGTQRRTFFTNEIDVAMGPGPDRTLARDRVIAPERESQLVSTGHIVRGDGYLSTTPRTGEKVLVTGGGATAAWDAAHARSHGAEVDWIARPGTDELALLRPMTDARRRLLGQLERGEIAPEHQASAQRRLQELDSQLEELAVHGAPRADGSRLQNAGPFGPSNLPRNTATLEATRGQRSLKSITAIGEPITSGPHAGMVEVSFSDGSTGMYHKVVTAHGQDASARGGAEHLLRDIATDGGARPIRARDEHGRETSDLIGVQVGDGIRVVGPAASANQWREHMSAADSEYFGNAMNERAHGAGSQARAQAEAAVANEQQPRVSSDSWGVPIGLETWADSFGKLNGGARTGRGPTPESTGPEAAPRMMPAPRVGPATVPLRNDPDPVTVHDGKRHEAAYLPQTTPLFSGPPTMNQVRQGYIADCYLIASLGAIAKTRPDIIEQNILDHQDGTATVTMYTVGRNVVTPGTRGATKCEIRVSTALPSANKSTPTYASSPDGALWPSLYEKAYAIHMAGGKYQGLNTGGHAGTSMEALTGTRSTGFTTKSRSDEQLVSDLRLALSEKKPVVAGSLSKDDAKADPQLNQLATDRTVFPWHAYVVESVTDDGRINLYNPWGKRHPQPLTAAEFKRLYNNIYINMVAPATQMASSSPPSTPTSNA